MATCGQGRADGVGDPTALARRAAARAVAELDGRRPDLACVFVAGSAAGDDPDVAEAALAAASAALGAATTLGCTAGAVHGAPRVAGEGLAVAVWAATLPGARLRAFHLEALATGSSLAVVGTPVLDGRHVGLLLADPWTFPAGGFVDRSAADLPGLSLVGGLAHGTRPGAARLLLDRRVLGRGAVGVLLDGPVAAHPLLAPATRPIGAAMTVTAAQGRLLVELAGRPAARALAQAVVDASPRDQALAASGVLLGVAADEHADGDDPADWVARGPLVPTGRALAAEVGVDVGSAVRFLVADPTAGDAALLARLVRHRGGQAPAAGALLFTPVSDGTDAATARAAASVRHGLATDAVAGFAGPGAIGPVAGRNRVHGGGSSVLAVHDGAGVSW